MNDDAAKLTESLLQIAREYYRFKKIFWKALGGLPSDEQEKYESQFSWFAKKVERSLEDAGFQLVNVEGQLYDPGMSVTVLNLDDFDADDELIITQMIEPIIMGCDGLRQTGTVLVGRKQV